MNWMVVAVMLALLAGCGGSDKSEVRPEADGPPPAGSLPAIPQAGGDGQRAASVSYNVTLEGHEYFETNSQNGTLGQLLLNPGEFGPTAWAIYQFAGLAPDVQVDTLAVSMFDLSSGAEYYIALADYSSGRWQVLPQVAGGTTALFNITTEFDPARHLRGDGSLFVAVIAYGASGMVDFLTLSSSGSLARPANLVASDARYSQRVAISWDPVAGAEQYELFSKEAGQGDEFYALLVQLPSTETSFDHTLDNPASRPAVYGTIYEYKVKATASGEEPSEFSMPDEGERRIAAPTAVHASDRAYPDSVFIIWETLPHDTDPPYSYKLYRDGELLYTTNLVVDGLVGSSDNTVMDLQAHEYYVVDSGPEGDSYPSPVDTGCLAGWTEASIVANASPVLGIYSDLEISPDGVTPAVSYIYSDENRFRYALLDGPNPTESQIGIHGTDKRTALEIDNAVPYIMYNDTTAPPGEQGLYIVRGKAEFPDDFEDGWDRRLLQAGSLAGGQVVLEKVGGRMAALFLVDEGLDNYTLHYAYATKTGPLEPSDWMITDVVSYEGDFPPYFDLAELDGRPVVATLGDAGWAFLRSAVQEPSGSLDWTAVPLPVEPSPLNPPSGLDLVVHEGLAHVVVSRSIGFSEAGVWHLRSMVPDPASAADWQLGQAYRDDNAEFDIPSLLFLAGQPWLAVSSSTSTSAILATPFRNDMPPESYPWFHHEIENTQAFEFTRDEVKLVLDNGSLGCLFSGFKDGDGLFRRLLYQRLSGKGN